MQWNYKKDYCVHLTLTVAENESEIDFKHFHRVIQFISQRLKRAGADFKYVASKELQERGAVHYHVLCIYNRPYVFPSPDEISSSSKLGFVKITAPKVKMKLHSIARYIGKYIGKGHEYEAIEFRKSFTASQIKQIYKLSSHRLLNVIAKFGKEQAEQFKCTYRKVFEVITFDSFPLMKKLVMEFPSEWIYEGVDEVPF
ncbi:MAG TPA: hypothetical protein VJ024_06605 [Thermodesulfovibrionales bacterium]|nr:hypothetical protein [Thermodesulfovibrionales bacterium]